MNLTNTYNNRSTLAQEFANKLPNLFDRNEVELIPFGFENISKGGEELKRFIDSPEANLSHSAMMVKFAPDFILFKKKYPQEIYFLEVKASVTPLWASSNFNEIKELHPNVKLTDVGLIAREAWNAYRTHFPNSIILSATTYNPTIIKAQFVSNIKCLRCNGKNGKEDCSSCPIKRHAFFENSRNFNANGSGTQHTNLDLSSFLEVEEFFKQIDITIDKDNLKELKEFYKKKGVQFPSICKEFVKVKIRQQLKNEGCDWL